MSIRLATPLLVASLLLAQPSAAQDRSYQTLRWTEDWSWLADVPRSRQVDVFDPIKHVALGDAWWMSLGGSSRLRLEADGNRTLGASPIEDEERLLARGFFHWQVARTDRFRWFSEIRYSDAWSEERPVPALFRDDVDVQNFFFEFRGSPRASLDVTLRLGRQELLFGAQRLVSPLNWTSTRRTFDGITLTLEGKRAKTVIFATHPVAHEIHDIDSPIDDQVFWGAHATIKGNHRNCFEAYLHVQSDSRDMFSSELSTVAGDLDRRTFGGRWVHSRNGWRVDLEAALQDGEQASEDISAWMASGTVSHSWKDARWKPALSVGIDLASGDGDPADGDHETFNQLFPLGHAYLGHLDLVGRQNVEAARIGLMVRPTPRSKWVLTLHRLGLAQARDALYNAGGAALREDSTGAAGDDVGMEIDLVASFSVGRHHSISAEVVKFWSGDFVQRTGKGDDAWFGWLAYEFKY